MARWRDGAMARWRDGAMARWRDGAGREIPITDLMPRCGQVSMDPSARTPASLKTLAIARVLELGLARETLPEDLRNELRQVTFRGLLAWAGKVNILNEQTGASNNVRAVLQRNRYGQKLLLEHDRRMKRRSFHGFVYQIPYAWFYLEQEPDFEEKYPPECVRTWAVPRREW